MIQLEQQQHGEFWVGGVGWWVGWVTYQLPISSSLCGWINRCHAGSCIIRNLCSLSFHCLCGYFPSNTDRKKILTNWMFNWSSPCSWLKLMTSVFLHYLGKISSFMWTCKQRHSVEYQRSFQINAPCGFVLGNWLLNVTSVHACNQLNYSRCTLRRLLKVSWSVW